MESRDNANKHSLKNKIVAFVSASYFENEGYTPLQLAATIVLKCLSHSRANHIFWLQKWHPILQVQFSAACSLIENVFSTEARASVRGLRETKFINSKEIVHQSP